MLRHAIIGAGAMGRNHARVTADIRDVEIALIVDTSPDRARALAELLGASWATELPESLESIDTAVVAVPTELHCEFGTRLLEAGVHTLVEKPLAGSLEDAEALVKAAVTSGCVLMTGHVEQFGTSIQELDRWLEDVVHVEACRVGPFSGRVREGVIFDLMIHDLDIVRRIVKSPMVEVQAVARRTRSETEDLACALLCFESGATAAITASRIGQNKIRHLEITQLANTISIDLLRQDVMIRRMSQADFSPIPEPRYRQSGVVEIPFLELRGEPLALEVRHFFDCVKTGDKPLVSGEDGLEAVRWALQVTAAAYGAGHDGRARPAPALPLRRAHPQSVPA